MVRIASKDLIRITLASGATVDTWVWDWSFQFSGSGCHKYSLTHATKVPRVIGFDIRQIAAVELLKRRWRLRWGAR